MSQRLRPGRARLARSATFALSLCLAQQGLAQTLAVDAGDHEGFTRLVIRIGADRTWTLQQADRAWRLSLSPGLDGFDLSGSFDLIQRSRIADLSQEEDALVIALACDCDVSAFRFRDEFMVIDVTDPGETGETGETATAAMPEPAPSAGNGPDPATGAAAPTPDPDTGRPAETAAARAPTPGEIAAAALPDLARLLTPGPTSISDGPGTAAIRTPPQDSPPPEPTPGTSPDLEEAAQIMAEQLARAAAAGLLEPAAGTPLDVADPVPSRVATGPSSDGSGTPPPDPLTTAPAQPVTAPGMDAAPERLPPADPPILARNAFDIASAPRPDDAPVQRRLDCIGRAHPLTEAATGEDGDARPLGALRQAVFDDRDRLVEDAVLDLATWYLRHGFGAEAVFWLTRLQSPPADLVALGQMVDGLEIPPFPLVSDTSACSDQELVFRYIGSAIEAPLAETEAHRIQQGFASLPDQLQRQFGPMLARRLSAEGHAGTARNLRDMLRQSRLVPDAEMLTLDLDLGLTPPAPQVDAALSQALRDDGATPAATMSRSLAVDRQEGRRPDPDRLVAAEALLRETPPGRDVDLLWREIAIGHARLGQIDAALATLMAGSDRAPEVWQSALTGLVADRLSVEDGATLLILAHLVGSDWTEAGSETGRIRVAASRFLAEAGLAEAASRIMSGRPAPTLPAREEGIDAGARSAPDELANAWAEAAGSSPDAREDIASRMAARDAEPAGAPAMVPGQAIDLDALTARIADSQALRDAAAALLEGGERPLP
ncbi:MAG: hypothetical protein ACOCYW_01085 [Roseicyclus sp.]